VAANEMFTVLNQRGTCWFHAIPDGRGLDSPAGAAAGDAAEAWLTATRGAAVALRGRLQKRA
jgi:hypothetical protein